VTQCELQTANINSKVHRLPCCVEKSKVKHHKVFFSLPRGPGGGGKPSDDVLGMLNLMTSKNPDSDIAARCQFQQHFTIARFV